MFTLLAKTTTAAALALAAFALPAGTELPGEMAATYEDGPYSWTDEAITAHADPDYIAPTPATPEGPVEEMIAFLGMTRDG